MKMRVIGSALIVLLCMSGCSMQIPEKMSVKTDATYEFMLGKLDKSLAESFDINSLQSGSSSGIKIYDYRPDGVSDTTKRILATMKLYDVDLDFAELFNQTDISDKVDKMSFSQEVSIPVSNQTNTYNEPVSEDAVANAIAVTGKPVSVLPQTFVTSSASVSYGSYATAYISFSGISGDSVTLTTDGVSRTGSVSGSSAYIDISNFTINSSTTIHCSGGSGTFDLAVVPGAFVSSASGVSLELPAPITQTLTLTMDSIIKACTVGEGNIKLSGSVPSGWTGSISAKNVEVSGAVTVSSPTGTVSLNGKSVSNGEITIKANIALNDISFSSFGDGKFNGKVETEITSFSSVTVAAPDNIETSFNKEHELSEEYTKIISNILFDRSGMKVKYTNTFPAGNDFKLKAKSDFIGLTETEETLSGASSEDEVEIFSAGNHSQPIATGTKIDFKAEWKLPGWDPVEKTYTVTNIVPGEKYRLAIELKPVMNWISVTIKENNGLGATEANIPVDISFSSMFDALGSDLKNNFSLNSLPVYLYCEMPSIEVLKDVKIKGSIVVGPKESESGNFTNETTNILGSQTTDGEMKFESMPEIIKNDKGSVTTNFNNYSCSSKTDFAKQINHTLKNPNQKLYVKSKLAITIPAITITNEQMQSLAKEHRAISVKAFMEVPLNFNVKGNTPDADAVYLNVKELMGGSSSEDLLGRSEATDISSIKNYISIIKSAKLVYKSKAAPFKSIAPDGTEKHVSIDIDFNSPDIQKKSLDLNGGSIELTRDEFENLMNTYPLNPYVKVKVPVGQFAVQQDIKVEGTVKLKVEADGKIPVFGGK